MLKIKEQKGFTLVELAIVLVIVGLLIGGILKGQELMHNSRVTATVAQLKSYEAAITNFYDMYKEKPGDLVSPETRIKDCDNCYIGTGGELGNGKVGDRNWTVVANQSEPITVDAVPGTTAGTWGNSSLVGAEAVLFWYELLKTGLISGVTGEGLTAGESATIGGTIPGMKVGGGLWAGNSSGSGPTAAALGKADKGAGAADLGIRGTVLVTVLKASQSPSVATGVQPFYPKDAANIDRKLDDGLPNSGNVESYGAIGSCVNNSTDSGIYAENTNSKDCGLIIRVFK